MTKTYLAPRATATGIVVRDTLNGATPSTLEIPPAYYKAVAGSLGFYL